MWGTSSLASWSCCTDCLAGRSFLRHQAFALLPEGNRGVPVALSSAVVELVGTLALATKSHGKRQGPG